MDYVSHTITGITGSEDFITNTNKLPPDEPSIQDALLNDSRITPTGNGNQSSKPYCTQPTSGQKWWASVLLGFIFALISSPAAYNITSLITKNTIGLSSENFQSFYLPTLLGLIIHTIIFIIVVRIILW